jgi:hypothetical protein
MKEQCKLSPSIILSCDPINYTMKNSVYKNNNDRYSGTCKGTIAILIAVFLLGDSGLNALASGCWFQYCYQTPGDDVTCTCSGSWGTIAVGTPACPPAGITYYGGYPLCADTYITNGYNNYPKDFTFTRGGPCDSATDWVGVIACVGVSALVGAGVTVLTGGSALVVALAALGTGTAGFFGCGPCAYVTCGPNANGTTNDTFKICDLSGTCLVNEL